MSTLENNRGINNKGKNAKRDIDRKIIEKNSPTEESSEKDKWGNVPERFRQRQILDEYIEVEGIEFITVEEITNLFGESSYYSNRYYIGPYHGNYEYLILSDYDQHQIENGYDQVQEVFLDEYNSIEYHIIPGIDILKPYEVEDEDLEMMSCSFEEFVGEYNDDDGLLLYVWPFPKL